MEKVLPAHQAGWQGAARLSYELRAEKCVQTEAFTQAPLKVQKPLYPEGDGICHTVLVHTAGGMVAGDGLAIDLKLSPDCHVLATTAAANKVYGRRSEPLAGTGNRPESKPLAHQRVRLELAEQTCLEWFPQEMIVFDGAYFRQDIRVELAPDALWCGWDITRFGRSARGERFNQGEWRSHLEVWQVDRPLWIDRQFLQGGTPVLDSPNGLAGHPVIGSFTLLGRLPEAEHIETLRKLWDSDLPGDVGVTRLQNGLLCRYRGPSSQAARRWFVAAWQYLRPWYREKTVTIPRVWTR
jgi:urease accessory protein